jgi:steroid delta-isomerase-like uncharacterized protein
MSITTTALAESRRSARLATIDEHIRSENRHDLDGIMKTFSTSPRYDDEPWNAHYTGYDAVRAFYDESLRALPDLRIDVRRRYESDEAVIIEEVIRGTHLGTWRGLPPTGRRVEIPLCAIFTFDGDDRLAGEKIYYDRAMVLQQLGVLHEPEGAVGRLTTALMHPLTFARILGRMVFGR